MDDAAAILRNSLSEDSFEVVMRGYNRRQVDRFVLGVRARTQDLEAHIADLTAELVQARIALSDAGERLVTIGARRGERPAHEELSERLSEILRLAHEEAEQERTSAAEESAQLVEAARAEAEDLLTGARRRADDLIASAREASEHEDLSAREESRQVREDARREAEYLLTEAVVRAETLLDQARQRVQAIQQVEDDRVTGLLSVHAEAVRRLDDLRNDLDHLLDREEKAGPLGMVMVPASPVVVAEEPVVVAEPTADDGLPERVTKSPRT
jgi:cell division septum initiation protein DivIVA